MSRLEEVKKSIERLYELLKDSTFPADVNSVNTWYLQDISETLAMIYDKMCEKVEGNDDSKRTD